MEKISVVVPCYNEEKALPIFREALLETFAKMDMVDYEVIFVNDGSRDGTLDILREQYRKNPKLKYLSFSRNFGKEAGIFAGFQHAQGDWIVMMDADMQDPPDLLPEMFEYVRSGEYDSVATKREDRKGEPPVRSFFARMFYKLINKISDAEILDGARDYRLMSRKMVNAILDMGEYNRFSKGIFGWIGFRTKWIPYENRERVAGETKWSFWKLFKYSIDGIVNFSSVPLQISSGAGIALCFIAFLATIFLAGRKLIFGDPVAGWASLACIITFLSGIQLFSMGIMGQYLARIYMEAKGRPKYILQETSSDLDEIQQMKQ